MLLNFQEHFAALVESGAKRQTIRAPRKDGKVPKVGETLYLWTGCRTKSARKLGEHTCTAVDKVEIHSREFMFNDFKVAYGVGESLLNEVAKLDGFRDWYEMRDWFKKQYGLPFRGHLIRW